MTTSSITGRRQGPWLRGTIWVLTVTALVALLVPGTPGVIAGGLAVTLLVATPLLRVVWIVIRLAGERDGRFVRVGLALLSAVAIGVLISMFLRG
ncbi:MAG: hypothetical protein WEA76_10610 [Acidimicrobiia bacterium]